MPTMRTMSYWEAQHWLAPCDVAIVGGGIVGQQTALYLHDQRPDLRLVVLERGHPPVGASTRNAGFACIGSLGELGDDIAAEGLEATLQLVRRRYRGLQLLRERVGDEQLNFSACGNIEWFRPSEEEAFAKTCQLLPTVNAALGDFAAPFVIETGFRQNTGLVSVGAIRNRAEGQLDPGNLMRALQQDLRRRDIPTLHFAVAEVVGDTSSGFTLISSEGIELRARTCVVAVNGFAARLLPETPVAAARNQVIVTAPVIGLRWQLPMHLERGYGYIRRIGDRVLVGGFRNHFAPPADATCDVLDAAVGAHLRAVLQEVLPKGATTPDIDYEWAGTLGIGPTRNPVVNTDARGLVQAVGLGGMGVALGSLLGYEAANKVLEQL